MKNATCDFRYETLKPPIFQKLIVSLILIQIHNRSKPALTYDSIQTCWLVPDHFGYVYTVPQDSEKSIADTVPERASVHTGKLLSEHILLRSSTTLLYF